MRARGWVALALGLLGGCAAEQWSYNKPGLTPAGLDQDLTACRKEAHRPYAFAVTHSRRVDQDALNQCMARKGYTVRPDA